MFVAEHVVAAYLPWWKNEASQGRPGVEIVVPKEGRVHVALKCEYVAPALKAGATRDQVVIALGRAAKARYGGGVKPAPHVFQQALVAACGGQDPSVAAGEQSDQRRGSTARKLGKLAGMQGRAAALDAAGGRPELGAVG